jgi:hypothetical protein
MTDSAKPAPRVIKRGDSAVSAETRVVREAEADSETYSASLSNGRLVTLREMNAGDLLYLEKALGNAGDMERSLKLATRLSCGNGRVTYEDLQRLKMKDLRVVTKLLGEAGQTDEEMEDEDMYPNE